MERPADCLCFHLRRTSRAVSRAYDEALAPADLKVTQFTLLAHLAELGPTPLGVLADAVVMERTTLTRNLEPLRRAGLVTVTPGADRRQRVLELTAAGRARFEAALPRWRRTQTALAGRLGPQRRGRLVESLRNALDATDPN